MIYQLSYEFNLKYTNKFNAVYLIFSGVVFLFFFSIPSTIAYSTGELLLIEPAKKVLTNLPPLKKIYNPQGSGFM